MDDLSRDNMGDVEQASSSTLGADGKPVDDAVALNVFFTRFNKVCAAPRLTFTPLPSHLLHPLSRRTSSQMAGCSTASRVGTPDCPIEDCEEIVAGVFVVVGL